MSCSRKRLSVRKIDAPIGNRITGNITGLIEAVARDRPPAHAQEALTTFAAERLDSQLNLHHQFPCCG